MCQMKGYGLQIVLRVILKSFNSQQANGKNGRWPWCWSKSWKGLGEMGRSHVCMCGGHLGGERWGSR